MSLFVSFCSSVSLLCSATVDGLYSISVDMLNLQ